ncbi:uncharacterized protein F5891DRAFT_1198122 [Suillus fuscotomentosus]|uniref:Uncharacterized protein n=1 Tax=Suillus fuscotomentosus TaxID=1912939 RepID=A0AAD4DQW2_9AGAM|nr:uncharacterized protein F5891DRAFT_1198122 [Suillus fuscotomentosus]KAG1890548.1 hypothetical protein F5891DRAFT_1198122 [Suillus fuscotomentosus]
MSSSPVISAPPPVGVSSPVHFEKVLGVPADIFPKRSIQDHDDAPHVTKRPYYDNDHSRIMGPINPNQSSFEESCSGGQRCATQSLPKGLPPPYQLGGHVPTALEHRVMTKNLLKCNEVDLSLVDVHQGKEIFKESMKAMPDDTVYTAVIAKQADVESKRLRALAAAWELESAEKHAVLLQAIFKNYAKQYAESMIEASYFERVLVKRSLQQLEDDADFTVTTYSHDFAAYQVADLQLDYLEEICAERKLPLEDDDSEDAEDRLKACVDSILAESKMENTSTMTLGHPSRSAL